MTRQQYGLFMDMYEEIGQVYNNVDTSIDLMYMCYDETTLNIVDSAVIEEIERKLKEIRMLMNPILDKCNKVNQEVMDRAFRVDIP